MATRPIVPRANGEGSLGVTSKYWGNTFTQKMNGANAVDMADFSTATLRQPSTAQTVGDIRYHATLPAGWYLECTTAGTTGSGALTITRPTVGGTVSDGTVTWTVRKNASTQDLTGYLPLSGGAMMGEIYTDSNTGHLGINGGVSFGNGARLDLLGKDYAYDPSVKGTFYLDARDGVHTSQLAGSPTGELLWNNNSLDKSAVVAESLGVNGYRKYASGLIEQWGYAACTPNGVTHVTFPITMSSARYVMTTPNSSRGVETGTTICSSGANNATSTGFDCAIVQFSNGSSTYVSGNLAWRAIGY